ncbi:MAG: hypothetical protein FJ387_25310 [Verrucomicrobia bacterium]|nr:hypothetical protein [Verrucomicrobiota bacterium]
MHLTHGLHLAYCTNIHRGESWLEILANLERFTLAVRDRVCPDRPYAIGLRLGQQAARELSDPATLRSFRDWLDRRACYVFTINGFPYGQFHGTRVKEQVYRPDWTAPERVEYTNLLFDLLARLIPREGEGSVSTVPGSFKEFGQSEGRTGAMRRQLWRCVEHVAALSERTGTHLHLGLEPEPLCYLETSRETVQFFDALRSEHPGDARLDRYLGVNYDTCHLAVEFEEPGEVLARLRSHQVRLSKIHLSSALSVQPTPPALAALGGFADDTYLHQVVARWPGGRIERFRDLPDALRARSESCRPTATAPAAGPGSATDADSLCRSAGGEGVPPAALSGAELEEWRIHFHVPLHHAPTALFANTTDHLLGVLDAVRADPTLCRHFEMETYTWDVMPPSLKGRSVVDHLAQEHHWTLAQFARRGFRLE